MAHQRGDMNSAPTVTPGFQVFALDDADEGPRVYQRRKWHKKTREGCVACKSKRVKCDESKPLCLRCQRNNRHCVYASQDHGDPDVQIAGSAQRLRLPSGFYGPDTFSLLRPATAAPFDLPSSKFGTPSLHLVQHFSKNWESIFPIPQTSEIMELSKSNPIVRNTILAITASHLRHTTQGRLQHRIAEHFQQSLALREYLDMLATPVHRLDQQGVNILLLCAALLNILAFALPPEQEGCQDKGSSSPDNGLNSSSIFNSSNNHTGWLALQAGVRPLLRSLTTPFMEQTLRFLDTLFTGGDREDHTITIRPSTQSIDCVSATWRRMFELDDSRDGSCGVPEATGNPVAGDIFRAPVTAVAWLRGLEPLRSDVFKHLMFLSKVHTDFRALLYQREERAVWLFGYWLGLTCRFQDLWWCGPRVRRDFDAVRTWLAARRLPERSGAQGEMWKKMMEEFASLSTVRESGRGGNTPNLLQILSK